MKTTFAVSHDHTGRKYVYQVKDNLKQNRKNGDDSKAGESWYAKPGTSIFQV